MPRYRSEEETLREGREDRARAYLAQARLYADGVTGQLRAEADDGHLQVGNAVHLATMNALLAIAEMSVPPEPGMHPMAR